MFSHAIFILLKNMWLCAFPSSLLFDLPPSSTLYPYGTRNFACEKFNATNGVRVYGYRQRRAARRKMPFGKSYLWHQLFQDFLYAGLPFLLLFLLLLFQCLSDKIQYMKWFSITCFFVLERVAAARWCSHRAVCERNEWKLNRHACTHVCQERWARFD